MIKSFPVGTLADGLATADFQTLAGAFAVIVSRAIPGHPPVSFPASAAEITMACQTVGQKGDGQRLAECCQRLAAGEEAGILFEDMLLLALPLQDGGRQVAVASHLDETVTALAAADWLRELAARLPGELLAAKRLWLDHETGLPNVACLRADLAALAKTGESGENRRLLLVEAPPTNGRDGFIQAMAVAEALRAFCRNARLFHLGQCLFAVLSEESTRRQPAERLAADLVWYLKNEGFHRVRVGCSGTAKPMEPPPVETTLLEASLLDRAWTALLEARRRGPFGFCDFAALTQAPARWRPNSKLLAGFPGHTPFAVLALAVADEARRHTLHFLAEEYANIVIDGRAEPILIFLADSNDEQARQWARTMLAALTARISQVRPHAGIAVHPLNGPPEGRPKESSKGPEILRAVVARAIKAIGHAEFYGLGGIAVFDAVTCNIAGDAAFADGNLPKATKEYRAGLALAPENANLLNSLGVTLAMLGNNGEARLCFQRALQTDAVNYMALCNLGFVAQSQNRPHEAIEFFARALPLVAEANGSQDERQDQFPDEPLREDQNEDHGLAQDLRFALGRLYCQTGRCREAVEMLSHWQRLSASERERRKAWRYLGIGLAGAGEKRQAMAALQRAVAANPGDHEAMSLLGELIMRFDEGDDIALSLCQKSVELAPDSPLYRLRLAEVEYRVGDLASALIHCPRPGRAKVGHWGQLEGRIAGLLSNIYQRMNETKKAARWAARR